jgi:carbamoyltransferase
MMLLRQSTHRMTIRYDPDIGFLYVPNLTARIPHESGAYYVRTNALGFRSDVEYRQARDSRPRILVFGDSYTAGDGCSNQERFSDRMGHHLNADVYNYGLSGSGTDQHLLTYERFAQDVEADLLILCVNVENIERIKAGHRESIDRVTGARVMVPKPYFTLEDDELRLHHVPVPRHRPHADSGRTAGATCSPGRSPDGSDAWRGCNRPQLRSSASRPAGC